MVDPGAGAGEGALALNFVPKRDRSVVHLQVVAAPRNDRNRTLCKIAPFTAKALSTKQGLKVPCTQANCLPADVAHRPNTPGTARVGEAAARRLLLMLCGGRIARLIFEVNARRNGGCRWCYE